MTRQIGLSVVVPVSQRVGDVETLYHACKRGVEATEIPY